MADETPDTPEDDFDSPDTPSPVRRVRVDQWSPGIRLDWTPQAIKTALRLHEMGDFVQPAKLATAMMRDDEIPGALSVSTNLIVGADFRLEPAEGDNGEPDPASQAVADEWESKLQRIWTPAEMGKMFDWYEMLGIAIGVFDWEHFEGQWTPKFRALNPENLWFDDGTVDPQTGLHGVWWYRARSGDEMVQPGDGRWVLWSGGRESWIDCAIRSLGTDWLIKEQSIRDLARYNERHGLPIVAVKVPSFSDPETGGKVLRDVRAMGSGTTMTLPSHMMPESGHEVGFDIELVEARDLAYDTFFKTMDRVDRKIKMRFLGTNTNELEGSAGSKATSQSGREIAMQKAQERYNRVKGFIRSQMIEPILPIMGTVIEPELLPDPIYLIEGDEDLKARAEVMEIFGKGLSAISQAGWNVVNIEQEAIKFGLELEEKPEPEPMPGAFGAPGVQDKPPSSSNGQEEEEDKGANLDAIGASEGFEDGQNFIDGLTNASTAQAEMLEKFDAVTMLSIVDESKDPEDMERRLAEHANSNDPFLLGQVFEKAVLLAQLAGRFAVQEDL